MPGLLDLLQMFQGQMGNQSQPPGMLFAPEDERFSPIGPSAGLLGQQGGQFPMGPPAPPMPQLSPPASQGQGGGGLLGGGQGGGLLGGMGERAGDFQSLLLGLGGSDTAMQNYFAQRNQAQAQRGITDFLRSQGGGQAAPPQQAPMQQVPGGLFPPPPTNTAGTGAAPRGIRNNNALNIEAGPFTQGQPGFAGSDGRFAKFETPEQGIGAAGALLDVYGQKHGLNTVAGIIGRWAPSSDGNNVSAYATNVARQMGVGPNDPLDLSNPETKQKLIMAMGQHENGRPIPMGGAPQPPAAGLLSLQAPAQPGSPGLLGGATPPLPSGFQPGSAMPPQTPPEGPPMAPPPQAMQRPPVQAPAQAAPARAPQAGEEDIPAPLRQKLIALAKSGPNGLKMAEDILKNQIAPQYGFQMTPDGTLIRTDPRKGTVAPIYQSNKPSFAVIGKDHNGNDVHGFVDPITQKVTPVNAQGNVGAGAGTQPSSDLTGDAFLQTLDKGRANQIRGIADGRMSPPGGMSLKSPQIQGLMRDVAQYEPGFDLTTWTARNKTRADFASGKGGQALASFNTTVQHLETLDKAIDGLGNSQFPAYNAVANTVGQAGGSAKTQEAIARFETARQAVASELTRAFRGSGGNVIDIVDWNSKLNLNAGPAALKAAVRQATELLRGRIEAVGDQYNRGMGKTTDPLTLLSPKAAEGIRRLSGESDVHKPPPAATGMPTRDDAMAERERRRREQQVNGP